MKNSLPLAAAAARALLALALIAGSAHAAMVTVDFSGTASTLVDTGNYLGGAIDGPFAGHLVYSTETTSATANHVVPQYLHMTIAFGSNVFETADSSAGYLDISGTESVGFITPAALPGFIDFPASNQRTLDFIIHGTFVPGEVPTSAQLAPYDAIQIAFYENGSDPFNYFFISGYVTDLSFSSTQTPEPGSAAMLAAATAALLNLRRKRNKQLGAPAQPQTTPPAPALTTQGSASPSRQHQPLSPTR